jgi:septum formation protein
VVESSGEESSRGADPVAVAQANALAKARGAQLPPDSVSGAFVLATDTVVATESRLLGKPSDRREALGMLGELQGREHQVISGVALTRVGLPSPSPTRPPTGTPPPAPRQLEIVQHASTAVRFRELSSEELDAYLDTGEWHGKAGAYAIQGVAALFVEEIRGEYANVVGLPLRLLADMLRSAGFDLLRRRWLPELKQV